MYFIYTTRFRKNVTKAPKTIQAKFKERLLMFEKDPFSEILHNHPLHGEYQDYRSINITSDWRVIYRVQSDDTILLVDIGTHSKLYQ